MVFLYVLAGAICAGISNLCMRRCLDAKGTAYGYLTFFFVTSLIAACVLNPIQDHIQEISYRMFLVGGTAGIFNIVLMILTMQALKRGPAGLTFAFQNAGSVLPAVLLFALFGIQYGFELSNMMVLGLLCVIIGLFWGSLQQTVKAGDPAPAHTTSGSWLFTVIVIFVLQGVTLSIFNWRCLLTMENIPDSTMIPFKCTLSEDIWFMPGMFFFASILQISLFVLYEKRLFRLPEILYGSFSGILNGVTTYLLLLASLNANPFEKGLIFPFFAVSVILLCSLWGQVLYKERVNWYSNALCGLGVFLGTLKI